MIIPRKGGLPRLLGAGRAALTPAKPRRAEASPLTDVRVCVCRLLVIVIVIVVITIIIIIIIYIYIYIYICKYNI